MIVEIESVELGDVCDLLSGFAFKSNEFTSDKDDWFLVKGSNAGHQSIDFDSGPWWKSETLNAKYEKYVLHEDDVILAMDRPIVGGQLKYTWIKKNDPKCLLVQRMARLRGTSKLDIRFLRYIIGGNEFLGYVDSITTGANVPHISGPDIKKFSFALPKIETQKRIAQVLSAYDDLIENNLRRIKLLEEMAQITYEEWFVRLRFPGHESATIKADTGLPEGWETKAISTICDVNKNSITARSAPETIRYIDISSAETGYYTTPQEMSFAEAPGRARRRVVFGDTIFSTVRPNRRIFSLVLENDPLLVASTGFAVLTPHRAQNFPFIYLTIAQQSFTDAAVAVAGGAAYPAVNQTDVERIKITVPTQELMNKFSDAFVPNFTIKGQLQRKNALLREARDILLLRLMTGMIDVETYQPANLLQEAA